MGSFVNSEDPDEILHSEILQNTAFHHDLHCQSKINLQRKKIVLESTPFDPSIYTMEHRK